MARPKQKKMTAQDKIEWDELYEYVKLKVMDYDKKQKLSDNMIYRLKGLRYGKVLQNNKVPDKADYSYGLILITFKYCSQDIQNALRRISFDNEESKFAYVSKIVEGNLNTVYMRLKNSEKSKERTEATDMVVATHEGAKYQKKSGKSSGKFDDLW